MKFGATYNVFDGTELFEKSLLSVRDNLDYINAIYQKKSYYGDSLDIDIEELMNDLLGKGLLDEITEFEAYPYTPSSQNQINKKLLGLKMMKKAKCDFGMTLDVDEFYKHGELKNAKEFVLENKIDSAYCQMQSYYKTPEYCLDPPEDYYVALLFRIFPNTKLILGGECPVLVDPTRRQYPIGKVHIFDRGDIEMHHMSYVRKNIRRKFMSSTAGLNYRDLVDELVAYIDSWEYPKKAMWMWEARELRYIPVKKVEDFFNINWETQ